MQTERLYKKDGKAATEGTEYRRPTPNTIKKMPTDRPPDTHSFREKPNQPCLVSSHQPFRCRQEPCGCSTLSISDTPTRTKDATGTGVPGQWQRHAPDHAPLSPDTGTPVPESTASTDGTANACFGCKRFSISMNIRQIKQKRFVRRHNGRHRAQIRNSRASRKSKCHECPTEAQGTNTWGQPTTNALPQMSATGGDKPHSRREQSPGKEQGPGRNEPSATERCAEQPLK